jgi:WD40 repeat protein
MGDPLGYLGRALAETPSEINCIDLSSSGKTLALGLARGRVMIVDLERPRTSLNEGTFFQLNPEIGDPISLLSLTDDSFVVGCSRGDVLAAGRRSDSQPWTIGRVTVLPGPATALCETPAGTLAFARHANQRGAVLHNLDRGTEVFLPVPRGTSIWVQGSIDPRGEYVALHEEDGESDGFGLYDLRLHRRVGGKRSGKLGQIQHMFFSPDAAQLAVACLEGVEVYTLRDEADDTIRPVRELFLRSDEVLHLAYRSDGNTLVVPSEQEVAVRLWSLATNREEGMLRPGFTPKKLLVRHNTLVVAGFRKVHAWDLEAAPERRPFQGHAGPIEAMGLSRDGAWLVSPSNDRTVKVWDTRTRQLVRSIDGFKTTPRVAAFSPDRRHLLVGTADPGDWLQVWNTETWNRVPVELGPERFIVDHSRTAQPWVIDFTADGSRMLISGDGCGLALWSTDWLDSDHSAEPRRPRRLLPLHSVHTSGAVISPDGQWIVATDRTGQLLRFDLTGGERRVLKPADRHAWHIRSLAWSADSRSFTYLTHQSRDLVSFDLDGRELLRLPSSAFETRRQQVSNGILVASPDGTRIALSGRSVTIWDRSSSRLLFALPETKTAVYCILFALDGKTLWVGGADGSLVA